MSQDVLYVGGLQLNLRWESPAENRKMIESFCADNPFSGDVLILPEMFSTGFTMNPGPYAEDMEGPTIKWMRESAQKWNTLIMGSIIIRVASGYRNRFLAVGPEGILAHYDKRHPFSMSGEDQHYEAGEEKVVFSYKGWRICPMICYDLRFPVWSRNIGVRKGEELYDLLIYVANWPEKRVGHWETLLQARAIENQSYVIGVNRVGTDGYKLRYSGNSVIVDSLGEIVDKKTEVEGRVESTLHMDHLKKVRNKLPFLADGHGVKV